MKQIRTEDAVGMALGHDVTQIIPGKFKGPRFMRGHLIREEDIPEFLIIGKEHVYVMELKGGFIHEDDAAVRLGRAFAGKNIEIRAFRGRSNEENRYTHCCSKRNLLGTC